MGRPSADERGRVIVVGGGPAGAATAIGLRRRGVRVLILDRARFPREKVCGDVLLPAAQGALRALGLDMGALSTRAHLCTGSRYVATDGREVCGEFRDDTGEARPWWNLRRSELDAWLLAEARAAGAEVLEGCAVHSLRFDSRRCVTGVQAKLASGESVCFGARAVVGADGASSVVARQVGVFGHARASDTCLAARGYARGVRLPAPYLEVFTSERTLPGCVWILPVGPDEVNVGVGVIKATSDALHCTPQHLFGEMRAASPLLAARLSGAELGPLRGWSLPGATEQRRIAGEGWLLVGNAGAMVDPFTGHGIHHALEAAAIAAEVLAAPDSAAATSRYEERCRRAFGGEVRIGAALQRVHARGGVMRHVVALCSRHRGARDTFFGLVGHSAPRRQLLSARSLARAFTRWADRPGVVDDMKMAGAL